MSPTSLIFFPCLPMFLLSPTSSSTSSSSYPFYPIATCVPVVPLLSLSFPCSSTVASPFFYALLLPLSCPCPVPGATCCLLPCTNKPVTPCSCHGELFLLFLLFYRVHVIPVASCLSSSSSVLSRPAQHCSSCPPSSFLHSSLPSFLLLFLPTYLPSFLPPFLPPSLRPYCFLFCAFPAVLLSRLLVLLLLCFRAVPLLSQLLPLFTTGCPSLLLIPRPASCNPNMPQLLVLLLPLYYRAPVYPHPPHRVFLSPVPCRPPRSSPPCAFVPIDLIFFRFLCPCPFSFSAPDVRLLFSHPAPVHDDCFSSSTSA